jgi:hypothetical protein
MRTADQLSGTANYGIRRNEDGTPETYWDRKAREAKEREAQAKTDPGTRKATDAENLLGSWRSTENWLYDVWGKGVEDSGLESLVGDSDSQAEPSLGQQFARGAINFIPAMAGAAINVATGTAEAATGSDLNTVKDGEISARELDAGQRAGAGVNAAVNAASFFIPGGIAGKALKPVVSGIGRAIGKEAVVTAGQQLAGRVAASRAGTLAAQEGLTMAERAAAARAAAAGAMTAAGAGPSRGITQMAKNVAKDAILGAAEESSEEFIQYFAETARETGDPLYAGRREDGTVDWAKAVAPGGRAALVGGMLGAVLDPAIGAAQTIPARLSSEKGLGKYLDQIVKDTPLDVSTIQGYGDIDTTEVENVAAFFGMDAEMEAESKKAADAKMGTILHGAGSATIKDDPTVAPHQLRWGWQNVIGRFDEGGDIRDALVSQGVDQNTLNTLIADIRNDSVTALQQMNQILLTNEVWMVAQKNPPAEGRKIAGFQLLLGNQMNFVGMNPAIQEQMKLDSDGDLLAGSYVVDKNDPTKTAPEAFINERTDGASFFGNYSYMTPIIEGKTEAELRQGFTHASGYFYQQAWDVYQQNLRDGKTKPGDVFDNNFLIALNADIRAMRTADPALQGDRKIFARSIGNFAHGWQLLQDPGEVARINAERAVLRITDNPPEEIYITPQEAQITGNLNIEHTKRGVPPEGQSLRIAANIAYYSKASLLEFTGPNGEVTYVSGDTVSDTIFGALSRLATRTETIESHVVQQLTTLYRTVVLTRLGRGFEHADISADYGTAQEFYDSLAETMNKAAQDFEKALTENQDYISYIRDHGNIPLKGVDPQNHSAMARWTMTFFGQNKMTTFFRSMGLTDTRYDVTIREWAEALALDESVPEQEFTAFGEFEPLVRELYHERRNESKRVARRYYDMFFKLTENAKLNPKEKVTIAELPRYQARWNLIRKILTDRVCQKLGLNTLQDVMKPQFNSLMFENNPDVLQAHAFRYMVMADLTNYAEFNEKIQNPSTPANVKQEAITKIDSEIKRLTAENPLFQLMFSNNNTVRNEDGSVTSKYIQFILDPRNTYHDMQLAVDAYYASERIKGNPQDIMYLATIGPDIGELSNPFIFQSAEAEVNVISEKFDSQYRRAKDIFERKMEMEMEEMNKALSESSRNTQHVTYKNFETQIKRAATFEMPVPDDNLIDSIFLAGDVPSKRGAEKGTPTVQEAMKILYSMCNPDVRSMAMEATEGVVDLVLTDDLDDMMMRTILSAIINDDTGRLVITVQTPALDNTVNTSRWSKEILFGTTGPLDGRALWKFFYTRPELLKVMMADTFTGDVTTQQTKLHHRYTPMQWTARAGEYTLADTRRIAKSVLLRDADFYTSTSLLMEEASMSPDKAGKSFRRTLKKRVDELIRDASDYKLDPKMVTNLTDDLGASYNAEIKKGLGQLTQSIEERWKSLPKNAVIDMQASMRDSVVYHQIMQFTGHEADIQDFLSNRFATTMGNQVNGLMELAQNIATTFAIYTKGTIDFELSQELTRFRKQMEIYEPTDAHFREAAQFLRDHKGDTRKIKTIAKRLKEQYARDSQAADAASLANVISGIETAIRDAQNKVTSALFANHGAYLNVNTDFDRTDPGSRARVEAKIRAIEDMYPVIRFEEGIIKEALDDAFGVVKPGKPPATEHKMRMAAASLTAQYNAHFIEQVCMPTLRDGHLDFDPAGTADRAISEHVRLVKKLAAHFADININANRPPDAERMTPRFTKENIHFMKNVEFSVRSATVIPTVSNNAQRTTHIAALAGVKQDSFCNNDPHVVTGADMETFVSDRTLWDQQPWAGLSGSNVLVIPTVGDRYYIQGDQTTEMSIRAITDFTNIAEIHIWPTDECGIIGPLGCRHHNGKGDWEQGNLGVNALMRAYELMHAYMTEDEALLLRKALGIYDASEIVEPVRAETREIRTAREALNRALTSSTKTEDTIKAAVGEYLQKCHDSVAAYAARLGCPLADNEIWALARSSLHGLRNMTTGQVISFYDLGKVGVTWDTVDMTQPHELVSISMQARTEAAIIATSNESTSYTEDEFWERFSKNFFTVNVREVTFDEMTTGGTNVSHTENPRSNMPNKELIHSDGLVAATNDMPSIVYHTYFSKNEQENQSLKKRVDQIRKYSTSSTEQAIINAVKSSVLGSQLPEALTNIETTVPVGMSLSTTTKKSDFMKSKLRHELDGFETDIGGSGYAYMLDGLLYDEDRARFDKQFMDNGHGPNGKYRSIWIMNPEEASKNPDFAFFLKKYERFSSKKHIPDVGEIIEINTLEYARAMERIQGIARQSTGRGYVIPGSYVSTFDAMIVMPGTALWRSLRFGDSGALLLPFAKNIRMIDNELYPLNDTYYFHGKPGKSPQFTTREAIINLAAQMADNGIVSVNAVKEAILDRRLDASWMQREESDSSPTAKDTEKRNAAMEKALANYLTDINAHPGNYDENGLAINTKLITTEFTVLGMIADGPIATSFAPVFTDQMQLGGTVPGELEPGEWTLEFSKVSRKFYFAYYKAGSLYDNGAKFITHFGQKGIVAAMGDMQTGVGPQITENMIMAGEGLDSRTPDGKLTVLLNGETFLKRWRGLEEVVIKDSMVNQLRDARFNIFEDSKLIDNLKQQGVPAAFLGRLMDPGQSSLEAWAELIAIYTDEIPFFGNGDLPRGIGTEAGAVNRALTVIVENFIKDKVTPTLALATVMNDANGDLKSLTYRIPNDQYWYRLTNAEFRLAMFMLDRNHSIVQPVGWTGNAKEWTYDQDGKRLVKGTDGQFHRELVLRSDHWFDSESPMFRSMSTNSTTGLYGAVMQSFWKGGMPKGNGIRRGMMQYMRRRYGKHKTPNTIFMTNIAGEVSDLDMVKMFYDTVGTMPLSASDIKRHKDIQDIKSSFGRRRTLVREDGSPYLPENKDYGDAVDFREKVNDLANQLGDRWIDTDIYDLIALQLGLTYDENIRGLRVDMAEKALATIRGNLLADGRPKFPLHHDGHSARIPVPFLSQRLMDLMLDDSPANPLRGRWTADSLRAECYAEAQVSYNALLRTDDIAKTKAMSLMFEYARRSGDHQEGINPPVMGDEYLIDIVKANDRVTDLLQAIFGDIPPESVDFLRAKLTEDEAVMRILLNNDEKSYKQIRRKVMSRSMEIYEERRTAFPEGQDPIDKVCVAMVDFVRIMRLAAPHIMAANWIGKVKGMAEFTFDVAVMKGLGPMNNQIKLDGKNLRIVSNDRETKDFFKGMMKARNTPDGIPGYLRYLFSGHTPSQYLDEFHQRTNKNATFGKIRTGFARVSEVIYTMATGFGNWRSQTRAILKVVASNMAVNNPYLTSEQFNSILSKDPSRAMIELCKMDLEAVLGAFNLAHFIDDGANSLPIIALRGLRKNRKANAAMSTVLSPFWQFGINQSVRFMNNFLPLSTLGHVTRQFLRNRKNLKGEAIGGNDLQAELLGNPYQSIEHALFADMLKMGRGAMTAILLMIFMSGADDEDKDANSDEYAELGVPLTTTWWANDMVGPSLYVAQYLLEGNPNVIFKNLGNMMLSNPAMKVSQLWETLTDVSDAAQTDWDELTIEPIDERWLDGTPEPPDVIASNIGIWLLNYANQFITPAMIRWIQETGEGYTDATLEHTSGKVFVKDANGEVQVDKYGRPKTQKISYKEHRLRAFTKNRPAMAWIMNKVMGVNRDLTLTGYSEDEMPLSVRYDPEMMSIFEALEIPEEASDAEKDNIYSKVIDILDSTENMSEITDADIVIPYDTKQYIADRIMTEINDWKAAWEVWAGEFGGDFTALGNGDFEAGNKIYRDAKLRMQQYQTLLWARFNKIKSPELISFPTAYNRYKTTYAEDNNGDLYATGIIPGETYLPFMPVRDATSYDRQTTDLDGELMGERALAILPTQQPNVYLQDSGDETSAAAAQYAEALGLSTGSSGYSSYRRSGGGGGGGGSPNIYSNLPSTNYDRASTAYMDRPYDTKFDYLRPSVETKGSRDAYKREDI